MLSKTAEEIVAELAKRIREATQERAYDAACNEVVHAVKIITLQSMKLWIESDD